MPPPSKSYTKPCRTCPTMLRADNRSGYCARCVKQSPEYRAKVAAGAKRRYADPAERARTGQAVRRANQADPTIRERKSAAMREIAATPEWQARNAENCRERRLWEKGRAGRTEASNVRQGVTFSQRHGIASWCPADYVEMARDALGFERFAIRHSDGGQVQDCTQSVRAVDEAVNSIVCPEQLGRTAACATCGLCWTTRRNIAFLEH